MIFIDTHCHIYLEEFKDDRAKIIERADQEGITNFLMPAIDTSTHETMFKLQGEFSNTHAMMGLHPCSIKENYDKELRIAAEYLGKAKFIAVGETGLDFYWDLAFTRQQYDAFHRQIEWAVQYDIPVVIHSRNSLDECIAVMQQHQKGSLKGVFHCFSGTLEQAQKIIDLGCYLGIGGVVTFKNSGLDKVMEKVSLDHVVLETDAPYLAPVPYRGKRNEPSYLKYVAQKLAGIKEITVEEVSDVTTRNAQKIFGL